MSVKSPEQLIDEKPIYSEQNYILYKKIQQILPQIDMTLTNPLNSKEVGKINQVNLDKDSSDEIIVFEKIDKIVEEESEINSEIIVSLIDVKDNKLKKIDNIIEAGNSIEYANFYDLNSDGIKEIILLVKNLKETNLFVYELKDNELEKIYTLKSEWIPGKENIKDIKVFIDFINSDDILDILVTSHNFLENKAYISVLNYTDKIKLIDFKEIEDVRNINSSYITFGNLDKNKKGIIIDYPSVRQDGYNTKVFLFENGKLRDLFENTGVLFKKYFINPRDINDDGIIEIPMIKNSTDSDFYINWNKLDLTYKDSAKLNFVSQIYYNYDYNFKMELIPNLVDKIYVDEETIQDGTILKFNYMDKYKNIKDIFMLKITNKNSKVEEISDISKGEYILLNNYNHNFNLIINNSKLCETLNINFETLKNKFSLID